MFRLNKARASHEDTDDRLLPQVLFSALFLGIFGLSLIMPQCSASAGGYGYGVHDGGSFEPGLVPWRGPTSLGPWGIQRRPHHHGGYGYQPAYYHGMHGGYGMHGGGGFVSHRSVSAFRVESRTRTITFCDHTHVRHTHCVGDQCTVEEFDRPCH